MAALGCKKGKCTGTLLPVASLPKNCTDTLVTTEPSNFVVRDDTGKDLAHPGTFVPPASADVP